MSAMPFLQIVDEKYIVRIVVPPALRPYLPPPHTGKANLTRALGTGNEREANRLAVPWIADFQAAITSAASITENPHGYDWITRYRAYHRGQNRFPPEARPFPTAPSDSTTGDADQTGPLRSDHPALSETDERAEEGQTGQGDKVWPARRMDHYDQIEKAPGHRDIEPAPAKARVMSAAHTWFGRSIGQTAQ
jgi:hypothetical protein